MDLELKQVLDDWDFIRKNTLEFIAILTDDDLVKLMPRPGINTFMKHFEEMCDVEKAYLDACENGEMNFSCVKDNDDYQGTISKDELVNHMLEQDKRMKNIVNSCINNIVWDEDDIKTLNSHLRNLCIHETLHLGQLIAFSYVMDIKIPEFIVESWALS